MTWKCKLQKLKFRCKQRPVSIDLPKPWTVNYPVYKSGLHSKMTLSNLNRSLSVAWAESCSPQKLQVFSTITLLEKQKLRSKLNLQTKSWTWEHQTFSWKEHRKRI